MSDRDFLDLDEDLLDDGPDAPVGEWDDDLMDDFPADDPAAGDSSAAPTAAAATAAASGAKASKKKPKKAYRGRSRPGGGGAGIGILCFFLVLLAGLTLGSGLLTAVGGAPETLIDFSGFSDFKAIGDFQAHPINAFWLAAAVTLLAAITAGVAVSRRMRGLGDSSSSQNDILEAIRHLDPEKPESWEREELESDPDLAAATSSLLGHFNLQQAKLERYVGLEGELHRLEKALVDESLDDLQGNWESPAAGSLADQAVRLLQASADLGRDADRNQQAFSEQGPDLVAGLRDARSWQASTTDQVKQQGSGIERIFRRLGKFAEVAPAADDDLAPRRERLRQAIQAVRQELESLPARAGGDDQGADGSLGTLIERASRLAFQIAMEVARLGAKGERLLPLTQDLEELTTELRAMVDGNKGKADHDDPRDRILENVRGRLAELDPAVLEPTSDDDQSASIAELAPVAGEVAAGLANLTKNFAVQEQRLSQMLQLASLLTGVQADQGGDPGAAPGSGMLVDRFDPFASGSESDSGLVADPFATKSSSSIFSPDAAASEDFAHSNLPGQEETGVTPEAPAAPTAEPDPGFVPGNELVLDESPAATSAPSIEPVVEPSVEAAGDPVPPAPVDSPLPSDDEKVYDLSEFDALPMQDGQLAAEPAEERIYDLSEFGAVKIE